jgi:hypothetical protein
LFQPLNRDRFKQQRKSTPRFRPWQLDNSWSVIATVAARNSGMQDRAVLTRIQMPPLSLLLMVEQFAGLLTFRTRPRDIGFVSQINVNLSMIQLLACRHFRTSSSATIFAGQSGG